MMNLFIRYFFIVIISLHAFSSKAADSTITFTVHDFFAQVLKNHPVAKQAGLLNARARQEIRIARGMMDPTLWSKFYQKEFQSKDYYTLWDNQLRIPTWYGIDIKTGYERNTGPFVSGENQTPLQGLTYAGISVPIGQGLLIDERRSQIRQAQQMTYISEAERIKAINKLLLQAAKDYWDWMFYYNKLDLYQQGYDLANLRYGAVKERVKEGDLPAIDTVESLIQVQNFNILLTQSEVEFKNASLILSNYLWNEAGSPVELTGKIIPSKSGSEINQLSPETISALIERGRSGHPDLVKLNAKSVQLSIERRFIADKFKPRLYLDYNFLQTSFTLNNEIFAPGYLGNNYKVGASLSYPLFLRNERGKYQLTKIKILENNYELKQQGREIENNIKVTANELQALEKQIQFQESLVRNSDLLRIAEQTRFENGESSIFLINSRESTLISSRIKLYELIAKYAKSKVLLQWTAGMVQ